MDFPAWINLSYPELNSILYDFLLSKHGGARSSELATGSKHIASFTKQQCCCLGAFRSYSSQHSCRTQLDVALNRKALACCTSTELESRPSIHLGPRENEGREFLHHLVLGRDLRASQVLGSTRRVQSFRNQRSRAQPGPERHILRDVSRKPCPPSHKSRTTTKQSRHACICLQTSTKAYSH